MDLHPVNSKLSGLQVLAPWSLELQSKQVPSEDDDEYPIFNEEMIEKIYMLYKEYISSFSPNLNQNQILLYIYK